MRTIVQKFGGTSLADVDHIRRCAARVVDTHRRRERVVVVVSAMGDSTDRLIELARRVSDPAHPSRRELDLLLATGEQVSAALMAMAVQNLGVDAVSFTAQNLGIRTDPVHCNAKIHWIDTVRIERELDRGRVVIATGFQGISAEGDITTLGRGGSDTTAVAIAAALRIGAERERGAEVMCEIYTDVDGVYTANPRLVPNARKLERISSEEMVELAALGAGVLHPRAVMFGQRYDVPVHVRHSMRNTRGTVIAAEPTERATTIDSGGPRSRTEARMEQQTELELERQMEQGVVVGCALNRDLQRITVRGMPNRPGVQAVLFQHIAAADLLVDDIMQIQSGECADVSFTVERTPHGDVERAVGPALREIGGGELSAEAGFAKVSVVGVGMRTHTGVAARMFEACGRADIRIENITTSEIKISCLVPERDGPRALQVIHDAFGLGEVRAGHAVVGGDAAVPDAEPAPAVIVRSRGVEPGVGALVTPDER